MATYAIGDVQGCFGTLCCLLERIAFDAVRDRLWFAGDLVNRGPRSLETLRFVRNLGASALTVLGNHDLSLLMAAEGLGKRSRGDTFDDVLKATDRTELLDWLRHQPLCHVEDGFCLVHAGLLPAWDVMLAQALAGEVENALTGTNWREFFAHLWGSEPAAWDAHLTGWARLRVIVNAMTRLRFCTPEGTMDFQTKGEAASAPAGYLPWFAVPGRRSAEATLIFGHWSALGLKVWPHLLATDSGCVWGGMLTAIRLEDRAVFQVPCLPEEACPLSV